MKNMAKSQNRQSYDKIFTKLKDHHKWFENSIPFNSGPFNLGSINRGRNDTMKHSVSLPQMNISKRTNQLKQSYAPPD